MRTIKRDSPSTRFVLLTGVGSVSATVTALREGADDVIEKPISKDQLFTLVAHLESADDGGIFSFGS